MKKLNKKSIRSLNSIESYACNCASSCSCSCLTQAEWGGQHGNTYGSMYQAAVSWT